MKYYIILNPAPLWFTKSSLKKEINKYLKTPSMDNATEAFNAESIRSNCPPSLAHLSLANLLGPGLSFEKRKQLNTGSIVYPGTVQDTEILK